MTGVSLDSSSCHERSQACSVVGIEVKGHGMGPVETWGSFLGIQTVYLKHKRNFGKVLSVIGFMIPESPSGDPGLE